MFNRKFLIAVAIFFLVPLVLLFVRFGASSWRASSLTISPQTTVIKGPLDADGYPDYVAALDAQAGDGVNAENNAVVLLVRALGPPGMPLKQQAEFYKRIGVSRGIEPKSFVDWVAYYKALPVEQRTLPKTIADSVPDSADELLELLLAMETHAGERPWTREELPELAGWLDANEAALELIVQATQRPRFYAPLLASTDPPSVYGVLLPLAQSSRDAARTLLFRAMLCLGEKRYQAAWDNLMACRRLGRLVGQGPMLVEALVGYAIEGLAIDGQVNFLAHAQLTGAEWAALQKQVDALPPRAALVDKIDRGERFGGLDVVLSVARLGPRALSGVIGGNLDNPLTGVLLRGVDWNIPLATVNEWMDRFVAVGRIEDPKKRELAAEQLEAELKAMVAQVKGPWNLARAVASRRGSSQTVGELLVGFIAPAMTAVFGAEARTATNDDLLAIGLALARYKATIGDYPEKLDRLSPNFIKKVPADAFAGTPFVYQKRDNGYLLYSLGANQKDEGGKSYDEEADDLAVEVPPRTKMQKAKEGAEELGEEDPMAQRESPSS